MPQHYLLIGTSAASISAALQLRKLDTQAKITCISQEHEAPYNTCLLIGYLAGERTREATTFHSPQIFEQQNINLRLSTKVIALEPEDQRVICADGSTYAYDKLFIGSGSQPIVPAIVHTKNLAGIFVFHTRNDADTLKEYLKTNTVKEIVVIGAGITGLECADACTKQGYKVTIIEKAPHILPALHEPQSSKYLEKILQNVGITCITNETIVDYETHNNMVQGIYCKQAGLLPAQVVIIATGTQSSLDFTGSTLKLFQNALITNEYMQTSSPAIYAGGDCIVTRNLITGDLVRSAQWPDAITQGIHAAYGMVGKEKKYPGLIPACTSHIAGTHIGIYGSYTPGPPITWDISSNTNNNNNIMLHAQPWHRAYARDAHGEVMGGISIGNLMHATELRRILLHKSIIA